MGTDHQIGNQHAIVLFDGVCNLCNASVNFVIDRDKQGYFRFASLQSEIASELLKGFPEFPGGSLQSILLVKDGKLYHKSSAALHISRYLGAGWPLMFGFIFVPRFIRDGVYNFIARNRYRWFGRTDSCRVPTPELRQRFLDS